MPEQILEGIQIIDISWGLAGPVATHLLAEHGADVVKVERPDGDPLRRLHPAAFATWNRSKRSIVLDLHDPPARRRLDDLLLTADVLVHGFSPSTATRHGLDDGTLAASHPHLIVCGITGYPPTHVDAERPGHELLVQARGGMCDWQRGWRDGPFAWRMPVASWYAAFLAATGITARLLQRERAGTVGNAHTSLLQGLRLGQNMAWCRVEHPNRASLADIPSSMMQAPQAAMYQCGDGRWLQVMNPGDRVDLSKLPLMVQTIESLGLGDVPFDAAVMAAAMTQRPADDWVEAIRAVDVAVELVVGLGEILLHPEAHTNGYIVEVDDPVFGPSLQAGPPVDTNPPARVLGPAPALGQHTHEILATERSVSSTRATTRSDGELPCDGIRVVDFGAFVAGPLGPMLLADLGADVIKVEPVRGDPLRGWRDEFFIAANRGKRDVAVDITHVDGKPVMRRLIEWADVVHHNIRLEAATRLGLDADSIRAVNPRTVFSHGTAYGTKGERAGWPGFDSVFQAMGGWNIELAGEGNPPLFNHLGNLDTMTAALSAMATLLSLFHRERTGEANPTHASLLSTATLSNSETLVRKDDGSLAPYPRLTHDQTGIGPGYRLYDTADGAVAVAAVDDAGLALLSERADTFGSRPTDVVLEDLASAGIPAEAVRTKQCAAVWDDEANIAAKLVVSATNPEWGRVDQFGAFWVLGDAEPRLDRACPSIGQHTREVLMELGYAAEDIEALEAATAIR